YHRKWDHLKNLQSLSPLPDALVSQVQATRNPSFKVSDHWMGRNLSILVKLSWDEKEMQTRCGVLKEVVSAVLDQ
ncbi:MAG: L-glutamine--2-deoxy-scyllo-inosose aminotransferase KanB, partial [Robiginitalea sp.]